MEQRQVDWSEIATKIERDMGAFVSVCRWTKTFVNWRYSILLLIANFEDVIWSILKSAMLHKVIGCHRVQS